MPSGESNIRLYRAAIQINGFVWAEGRTDYPLYPGRVQVPLALYEPSLAQSLVRGELLLDFRSEDEVEVLRARIAELEARQ